MTAPGVVVAAHQAAADAGARALAAGGSVVDAAVATALALAVVEPAQCGLGGYGGFLVYAPAEGEPCQIDFNTWIPARLGDDVLRRPSDDVPLPDGGGAVAPPNVVPGLLAAHARFGTLPLSEVRAPALRLAADGFVLGPDLLRALEDHWKRTSGGSREFAAIFFPNGRPPEAGSRLVQHDLAHTLEALSEEAFREGRVVDAICYAVSADGGFLEPRDFAEGAVAISTAEQQPFAGGRVFGPSQAVTGTGVLFPALATIGAERLGANRSQSYVDEMARALRAAWGERIAQAEGDFAGAHTAHLCAAAGDGSLASLTFTHGRRKFGSGLVASGTGIVLNAGVGLFSRSASGRRSVTNMAPVVIETEDGTRHAFGAVGGPRIPAIVLTSAVDVIHYGHSLTDSLSAAHLAVRPIDGALETEANLAPLSQATEWAVLKAGETFGPACGITRPVRGGPIAALDPRFSMGIAEAPAAR